MYLDITNKLKFDGQGYEAVFMFENEFSSN